MICLTFVTMLQLWGVRAILNDVNGTLLLALNLKLSAILNAIECHRRLVTESNAQLCTRLAMVFQQAQYCQGC